MGNILKERREELGKNIKEIAKITRIRASYLKLIEDEDFSTLPIAVYTRGYIKEYAKFLDVSVDLALAPYEKYLDEINAPKDKRQLKKDDMESSVFDRSVHQEQPGVVVPEKIDTPARTPGYSVSDKGQPSSRFSPSKFLWLIPLVVVIFTLYLFTSQKTTRYVTQKVEPDKPVQSIESYQLESNQPKEVQPSELAKPAEQPQKDQLQKEQPKTEPAKPLEDTKVLPKKKHNLDITATAKVWVQIVIDGSEKKEMTLNIGDKISYGANKSFNIWVGNAGGVKLKFDGKELKSLGNSGETARLSLPESAPKPPANGEKVEKKQKEGKTIPSSEVSVPQQAPQSNP